MIQARDLFELALTVQPTSVDGLAGVATTLVFEFLNGYYETGGRSGWAGRSACSISRSRSSLVISWP
jgi:hypothetical protein